MPQIELGCEKNAIINQQHAKEDFPLIKDIPYTDFFWNFLYKNRPCIIDEATKDWPATTRWTENGKPNYENLLNDYGSSSVPVVLCDSENCDKEKMLFSDYVNYWTAAKDNDGDVKYLKDWHLRREKPSDKFYTVPKYFSSDWLNEYSVDKNIDDFMFVYMGPKGSWTSFHIDVYSSYSWSANIVGKKRWLLFPPGEEAKFKDSFGNMPLDIENLLTPDIKYYEIIQNPGETIFIPSGWFHQVFNLENTISINHNWVNGCNIHYMWDALKENLDLVEKEIYEFKDSEGWSDHCQLMLKASFGTNITEFMDFIKHISYKRIEAITGEKKIQFDQWEFDKNHILFDLKSLHKLLKEILNTKYYSADELEMIICDIEKILTPDI